MMEGCCHGDGCCHRYIVKYRTGSTPGTYFIENTDTIYVHGNLTRVFKLSRSSQSFYIQILTTPWEGGRGADNAQVPQSDIMCPARAGGGQPSLLYRSFFGGSVP